MANPSPETLQYAILLTAHIQRTESAIQQWLRHADSPTRGPSPGHSALSAPCGIARIYRIIVCNGAGIQGIATHPGGHFAC
ncbi:protein of unknown function [Nitrospira defluvii]|uniref:Uncharacterized protein n=1 Tax=Nitrospira defluvii TaxID=330214 RepID=D8PI35_9BACT|nr:protein of unknown function [Nitrospira defluvii]